MIYGIKSLIEISANNIYLRTTLKRINTIIAEQDVTIRSITTRTEAISDILMISEKLWLGI